MTEVWRQPLCPLPCYVLDGDKLGVALDYKDDACLFVLKQFDRHSERAELSQNSLAFVRSADGAWLAQVRCQYDRT